MGAIGKSGLLLRLNAKKTPDSVTPVVARESGGQWAITADREALWVMTLVRLVLALVLAGSTLYYVATLDNVSAPLWSVGLRVLVALLFGIYAVVPWVRSKRKSEAMQQVGSARFVELSDAPHRFVDLGDSVLLTTASADEYRLESVIVTEVSRGDSLALALRVLWNRVVLSVSEFDAVFALAVGMAISSLTSPFSMDWASSGGFAVFAALAGCVGFNRVLAHAMRQMRLESGVGSPQRA
jgi:hypothetical protein